MNKFALAIGIAATLASPALADHHGRGAEQLNGFPGVYDVGAGRVTFTDDGYMVVSTSSANVAVAIWHYRVIDGVLQLRDASPPAFLPDAVRTCMRENWSSYTIVDLEGGFRLEPIEEPCPPRERLLTASEFSDYQRPG